MNSFPSLRELDPQRIILFGSRAEGHYSPGSDFDLAVDAPKPGGRAYSIRETVNDAVGLYTVESFWKTEASSNFALLFDLEPDGVWSNADGSDQNRVAMSPTALHKKGANWVTTSAVASVYDRRLYGSSRGKCCKKAT